MTSIMRIMNTRSELKVESLNRILDAGAKRLRAEGLRGAAIATVMKDAGLTHGAFYVHFANKSELAAASLQHALLENRRRWVGALKTAESWGQRLQRLARRYLTKTHRNNPSDGCALAALATEAAHGDELFRSTYQQELLKSVRGICCGNEGDAPLSKYQSDEAMAVLALCIGGIALSRAVTDSALSDQILGACIDAADRIGTQ